MSRIKPTIVTTKPTAIDARMDNLWEVRLERTPETSKLCIGDNVEFSMATPQHITGEIADIQEDGDNAILLSLRNALEFWDD